MNLFRSARPRGGAGRRVGALAAAAVSVAIIGAACGGGSGSDTTPAAQAPASSPAAAAAVSIETGAATLRAGLSNLLQEHVYLAGIATGTAIASGADSNEFKAAAAALQKNTDGLSAAIGSVYGDAGGQTFKGLWEKHIGFFVDYTLGAATKNDKMKEQARKDLDGYRADFGAFIESATGGILTKDAVATELKGHVESLEKAIDAQAAGDPQAFTLLRAAAQHMPMTADVLAGAIVKQFPDKFDGSVDSPASTLRTALDTLLQEHVYLAGIATGTALSQGPDSDAFKAAAGALGENTQALSDAVGSVYGDGGGQTFQGLWEKHIGFFVDYTLAVAGDDKAALDAAAAELDGYRADFGAFIDSATGGILPKDAVAQELVAHVQSLSAAISAQKNDPAGSFELLRMAAAHMPMTGDVLAGAIVKQFPDKFAS